MITGHPPIPACTPCLTAFPAVAPPSSLVPTDNVASLVFRSKLVRAKSICTRIYSSKHIGIGPVGVSISLEIRVLPLPNQTIAPDGAL